MSFLLYLTAFFSLATAIPFPLPTNIHSRQAPNLKDGAYLITYKPNDSPVVYKGPLMITSNSTAIHISGDLYNGTSQPDPSKGTPKLPRANYYGFLGADKLEQGSNGGFSLGLGLFLYNGLPNWPLSNVTDWVPKGDPWGITPIPVDGGYNVDLVPKAVPSGFPDPASYYEGEVKFKSNGSSAGKFAMGWVDEHVRQYTLEIAAEQGLERPMSGTSGTRTWEKVFAEAHVKMNIVLGKSDIATPEGGKWTSGQVHAAMLKYRNNGQPQDFDKEWRIFLIITRRLTFVARGVMVDGDSKEWNYIPREVAAVAFEWPIGTLADGTPDTRRKWPEDLRGKPFITIKDACIRTAFHEVGHFMNLPHPDRFLGGLMDDTDTYADAYETGESPRPFPENVGVESFRFNDHDLFVMAHRPDTHVRPGWHDFGGATPDNYPRPVPDLLGEDDAAPPSGPAEA
ncbi:hypothetical protein CC78DRAFT_582177 [Lojkania enalia]|uniref:Peptidase M43 pregnancy-associated plasma-A domain-containing protein n=1 Tax=Lojkania enalia TaxID=147567 RepID=A0A9P4K713_9PLEO|nr:hypothetical protein CC78DRAFT_582177 [Didymosphaeria enalia]